MNIKEIIGLINDAMNEMDYIAARKYMEKNLDVLDGRKHLLNRNARELYDFVKNRVDSGHQGLSKQDMAAIHAINIYAEKFDLRGLKLMVKERPQLFMLREAEGYLNNDAKVILIGMGVLKKEAVS
ncbi:hypothetical protein [Saliterribacillus persicus]|uniref:Uncharacterized protein n=1 Tax=Saliterribacillus persicus TaxID=930114 RepID=A0A368YAI5_9BACI|nr:hypothetical protein [Saliterribacillus persicus]RCW77271.1 hypothetical protein DFR57_101140 [Saliterribacillus persicus]